MVDLGVDIVDFFKEQTETWNEEQRCGFCYSFGAPLFNSEINVQQTDDCCMQVFLSNVSVKSVYNQNKINFTGFKQLDHCVYIDADLCFYSNPQVLFNEWGDKSVLIT